MVADRFRLRYRLTPEHYQSYRLLSLRRLSTTKGWKKQVTTLGVGALLGLALLVAVQSGYISDQSVQAAFAGALLAGLVMFLATFMRSGLARSTVGTHNALIGEFKLVAYDNGGIQITGRHITSSYEWTAFLEVTLSRELLVLWIDRGAGVIIPSRAFADNDEKQAFIEYVKERMAANSQPS